MIGAATKFLRSPTVDLGANAQYVELHFLRHHRAAASGKLAAFNLNLYAETDGSQITNDYAAALAMNCVVVVTSSMSAMAEGAAADVAAAVDAAPRGGASTQIDGARGSLEVLLFGDRVPHPSFPACSEAMS